MFGVYICEHNWPGSREINDQRNWDNYQRRMYFACNRFVLFSDRFIKHEFLKNSNLYANFLSKI